MKSEDRQIYDTKHVIKCTVWHCEQDITLSVHSKHFKNMLTKLCCLVQVQNYCIQNQV